MRSNESLDGEKLTPVSKHEYNASTETSALDVDALKNGSVEGEVRRGKNGSEDAGTPGQSSEALGKPHSKSPVKNILSVENFPMMEAVLNGGHKHEKEFMGRAKNPEKTNAYLVGSGIASLAAAVHLIQDANVPASQITIMESGSVPGGSMDGSGNPQGGYKIRGGRMLNFSYYCLYELLDRIPSLNNSTKTVMNELNDFNAVVENKTHARARLVVKGASGPEILDVEKMGITTQDRHDLVHVTMESERKLGTKRIDECFQQSFFQTKFWYMWATTFAFQPWHSAVEFRRYLHRFIHEFPRINTLAGVDRTPLNQYESIILPIEAYLKGQGVEFKYNTKVKRLSFLDSERITVDKIYYVRKGVEGFIQVLPADIVMLTIGSMTSNSSFGSNNSPPKPVPSVPSAVHAPENSWELWKFLANTPYGPAAFGNPSTFFARPIESTWLSFTVTLHDPSFFDNLAVWSGNTPGTGALITFTDSNWLMSIVVPKQPHFQHQPTDVQVFWGYGLFPFAPGNYINKPMAECTGEEILIELLAHFGFSQHPTVEASITIPCLMPFITSQFLTRAEGDRPKVIPEGSTNLALLGQFVEIEHDVVFTVEYSVRSAQMAVFGLMGLGKKPRGVYKGDYNIKTLVEALKTLLA